MKYLFFVPVAVLSIALQAQAVSLNMSPNAAQSGQTATSAVSVPAELSKKIDAKKARIGNEVSAVITTDTKLPDGTQLPKGTKLVGTVTAVPGRTNTGHLTFDFDRAVLHSGQTVLVHTTLTSVSGAPATMTADASAAPAATGTTSDVADQSVNYDSGTKMTLDVSSRRQ
jgi:hypothetical protein